MGNRPNLPLNSADEATNLLETWKKITPNDYKDKFPYAPKKIIRSPRNYNAYGGAQDNDIIEIKKILNLRRQ